MLRKIKNLLYGTFMRGMINIMLFLGLSSSIMGVIFIFTWTPVAICLCVPFFAMTVMAHLAFMPREFDTWALFPVGLKVSNGILRAMYWANSAEELDKLLEEYTIKYK